MTGMVGIAEFKAQCERPISQMEADGEPIQLTRRGEAVGVLTPLSKPAPDPDSLFGLEDSGPFGRSARGRVAANSEIIWSAMTF